MGKNKGITRRAKQMRPRARPAARASAPRKRPAAKEEEIPVMPFHYLRELAAAQLRCLGLIELGDARYYEGHVKVAGHILGLGKEEDFLEFRVSRTQTERLVDLLADPSKRTMQLHICQKDCSWQPTGEDVLNASGYWIVGEQKLPWHTLLEEQPLRAEEQDELARLRALREERQGARVRERDSPSEESKKKKGKKKKKKKKSKGKEKKLERSGATRKRTQMRRTVCILNEGRKRLWPCMRVPA